MRNAASPRLRRHPAFTLALVVTLSSLAAACGDDPSGDAGWGTFDAAMRVNTFRVRCEAGRFVGPVSVVAHGDTGPIADVRLLLWDLAAGTVSDEGRAEAVGTSYAVDSAGVVCDRPGTALVVVPVNDAAYGEPELEVAQPGVLNGGGARETTVPITLVVSEVGERAVTVTAHLQDLVGDTALTPIPLQRSAPGTWDAAWNGTLQPGFLMGALAYDASGALIGTFGL